MARLPGFVGPHYHTQGIVAADNLTFNWIPAKIESGTGAGGVQYVFDPAPGYSLLATGDTGSPCRASFQQNRECYMVQGTELVKVSVLPSAGIANLMAVGGVGPASITAGNFGSDQLLVSNGLTGGLRWYNTSTTANGSITTVNGMVVAFMDGFFLALDTDLSTLYISALNDATSFDPLDFTQRTDYPDQWMTMIVRGKDLFIFGRQTTSLYYNNGDADFPFVPNTNVAIQRGIMAPASLALLQGNPIWLADDKTVRMMQGYTPVRVSDHSLEFYLQEQTGTTGPILQLADAFAYNEQGHAIYVLNFDFGVGNSNNTTWCYDLTSGLWHRRGVYDAEFDLFGVIDAIYGVNVGTPTARQGTQIVGSRRDAAVYYYSQAFTTETNGTTGLTRRRRAPNLVSELKRNIYDRFELFMEVGTAPASPPAAAPTALLQWSNDGGHTFNTGVSTSVGVTAAYDTRVIWRRLGQGRNRVFQVTVSDAIQWRLMDAFMDVRTGTS